ncbi:hypothetical protein QFC21_004810 [Naganishia friedmannii]|uniref:Uncharacterized protein n=1 Tax=Naganishia friedmannii TaxID=89922 RepID=A0ACC2VE53_9TREE|nr:hypothetical protein QFC21_004810 [Naganishia friedmannii]
MSLQYTIHFQPRISSLSLTITDLDPCLLAAFQQICVESTPEEEGGLAIVLSHNDPYSTAATTVRIPISVHGGGGGGAGRLVPQQQQRRQTIALHPAKDSYECKIPCFPPLAGANHNNEERLGNTLDILVPPLSAEVLNKAHVSAARCKACGEVVWCAAAGVTTSIHHNTMSSSLPLLSGDCTAPPGKRQRRTSTSPPIPPPRPPPTYTFRALPSAHWHESSEAWLCHPSGAFTAKIQAQMERGWWPCDGVGLVAERVDLHVERSGCMFVLAAVQAGQWMVAAGG